MSEVARQLRLPETVEEFLVWPGDGSAKHYELVDGAVRAMAPPSTTHATIQGNLAILIGSHLNRHWPSCRLLITPGVIPHINSRANFRIPDLGVTCVPDAKTQFAMPDPLLLVEILSPSNEAETLANAWAYSTIPSLQEILLVHSTRVAMQVARRSPDGHWPQAYTSVGRDDAFRLDSIDLVHPVLDAYTRTHFLMDG